MNNTTISYNQYKYKEEQHKQEEYPTCFSLPLKSGVLAIGLIGSTMAVSGLTTYGIVQVPTLRLQLVEYFTNTVDITVTEGENTVRQENQNLDIVHDNCVVFDKCWEEGSQDSQRTQSIKRSTRPS